MATEENPDIESLLRFDPFAEDGSGEESESNDSGGWDDGQSAAGEDADGAGDAGSQQAESEGQQNGAEEPSKGGDAAAASGKPDESGEPAKGDDGQKDQELKFLREQVGNLSEQLRQMQQAGQQPSGQGQPQPGKETKPEGEEPIPDYQFQIPQQIADGVISEDGGTRAQALNALVAGIGQAVHKQVREEYQQKLEKVRTEAVDQASQKASTTTQADTIRQDYFGTYPHHNSDLVRPLVQQKTQEVMKEGGFSQWNDTLRNEIGRRVDSELQKYGMQAGGGTQGQAGQGQPGSVSGAPAGQNGNGQDGPPHMRRSGARPGGHKPGGANSESDIDSTLFG